MSNTVSPPTFSISVPVGAYHPFLPDCFASLEAQSPALQVALLDASGDPRVRELADRHGELFAYRRHGPDKGQSAAIIEGWAHTEGCILGWLNADDILFPHALETVSRRFDEDPALGAVYGHSTILDDKGQTTGFQWSVEPPSDLLLRSNIISQPSCFFRRSAYEAVGGLDANLHYTMDWDLFIRLYCNGVRFGFVEDVLSMVLWDSGTKTASFSQRRRTELQRVERLYTSEGRNSNIVRAFAINHAVEKMPPRLGRLFQRLLFRGGRVIRGVSADALITGRASIPMVHYRDPPVLGLRIEISNGDSVSAVMVDDVEVPLLPHAGGFALSLPRPWPAACPLSLSIAAKEGRALRFRAAAWADEPSNQPSSPTASS